MSNKLNFKFDRDFTVVPNILLRDKRLSYKAKGIFLQIISVPESWQFSVRGLSALARESDRAITSGLKELEACGYLEWCKTKTINNQFSVEVNVFLPDPSAILPDGKTSTGQNATWQNEDNKEKRNKSILEAENNVIYAGFSEEESAEEKLRRFNLGLEKYHESSTPSKA